MNSEPTFISENLNHTMKSLKSSLLYAIVAVRELSQKQALKSYKEVAAYGTSQKINDSSIIALPQTLTLLTYFCFIFIYVPFKSYHCRDDWINRLYYQI